MKLRNFSWVANKRIMLQILVAPDEYVLDCSYPRTIHGTHSDCPYRPSMHVEKMFLINFYDLLSAEFREIWRLNYHFEGKFLKIRVIIFMIFPLKMII